jgi:hypothetical protein
MSRVESGKSNHFTEKIIQRWKAFFLPMACAFVRAVPVKNIEPAENGWCAEGCSTGLATLSGRRWWKASRWIFQIVEGLWWQLEGGPKKSESKKHDGSWNFGSGKKWRLMENATGRNARRSWKNDSARFREAKQKRAGLKSGSG